MSDERTLLNMPLTYDEAVTLWGHRVAQEVGKAVDPAAEFEIVPELDYSPCDTCGPMNSLDLRIKGSRWGHGLIKELRFDQMAEILREIWSVEQHVGSAQ